MVNITVSKEYDALLHRIEVRISRVRMPLVYISSSNEGCQSDPHDRRQNLVWVNMNGEQDDGSCQGHNMPPPPPRHRIDMDL
jgi:hypothetical protein